MGRGPDRLKACKWWRNPAGQHHPAVRWAFIFQTALARAGLAPDKGQQLVCRRLGTGPSGFSSLSLHGGSRPSLHTEDSRPGGFSPSSRCSKQRLAVGHGCPQRWWQAARRAYPSPWPGRQRRFQDHPAIERTLRVHLPPPHRKPLSLGELGNAQRLC